MSNIFQLYRLQQLDNQIDEMKEAIKKNEKIIHDYSEVNQIENLVSSLKNSLEKAKNKLSEAEKQVNACKLKLSLNQNALYGGKVKNPKELQDLQLEASSLQKQLQALEDILLDCMIKVEEASEEYSKAMARQEVAKNQKQAENENLIKHNAEYEHKINLLEKERQHIIHGIDQALLESYAKIRAKKNGIAVSRITANSCSACGATLNSTLIQQARKMDTIVYCDTCSRMLYYG